MLQLKLREKADAECNCTKRFNLENNRGAKSILRKHLLPDGANGASCTNLANRQEVCLRAKKSTYCRKDCYCNCWKI